MVNFSALLLIPLLSLSLLLTDELHILIVPSSRLARSATLASNRLLLK